LGLAKKPNVPPLGVVAADFCLRSNDDAAPPDIAYKWGQGFAYEDIVSKLVAQTAELRAKYRDIGIIWAMHFPPSRQAARVPGFLRDLVPGFFELRNFARVTDAARANKIPIVLAGHIHENCVIEEKDIRIFCAGSSCSFGESAGNWMHTLNIDVAAGVPVVTRKQDYRWTEARGAFLPA
jgi:hypothetical protein